MISTFRERCKITMVWQCDRLRQEKGSLFYSFKAKQAPNNVKKKLKIKLVSFSRFVFLPWCNKMANTLIRGENVSNTLLIMDESLNCISTNWRTNLIVSVQHLQAHPGSINSMSIWINIIFSYLLYKRNDSANEMYNALK